MEDSNMHEQSYQTVNEQCCCFNLRKITRAVTQFFDRYLERAGIRATQFTLLVELSNSSGKTLTEMAEGLVMDRTTLTRNLKPLSKADLIVTVPLSDKRSKGYILTERGREVLASGLPLWQSAQKHIVDQLGHGRYQHLLGELLAMRNLAHMPSEGKRS
jgi:DNA-binding MarR family transcriptional regulator